MRTLGSRLAYCPDSVYRESRAVDMEMNRIEQQRRGYAAMSAMPPGNLSHPYRVLASILSITNDHGAHPTANDEVRKPFLYTTV